LGSSVPASQGVSAQRRKTVAGKIADSVANCDPSILSLVVVDQRDGHEVLAIARSKNLPPEKHATPDLVIKFGIAATVVWGAAETASQLLGRREFVIGAFSDQSVLLVGLQEFQMLLAIRLTRSSNAEHIYSKIATLLGTS